MYLFVVIGNQNFDHDKVENIFYFIKINFLTLRLEEYENQSVDMSTNKKVKKEEEENEVDQPVSIKDKLKAIAEKEKADKKKMFRVCF